MDKQHEQVAVTAGAILLLLAGVYLYTRRGGSPKVVSDPTADTPTDPAYQPSLTMDDASYHNSYEQAATGSADTETSDPVNPPTPDLETERSGHTKRLRATTYNIHYTSSNGDVQQSLTRLIPDSDVMILNEFTTDHTPILDWLTQQGWGHYYPKGSDTAIVWRKNKATFKDGKRYELSPPTWAEAPEHDDHTNNSLTRRLPASYAPAATLTVDGEDVTVIGAHTVSHVHNEHGKRPHRGALQTLQFRNLAAAIRQLSRHSLVIGGGDLNYDPQYDRKTARNVTAILADAHLRSNWAWLGEDGHGTLGGRFVDQFLTLVGQSPRLKLVDQRIVSGLHSDHNAVQATYQL